MLSQITQVLEPGKTVATSQKWNINRPIQTVGAAFPTGDHGPEYSFEKPSPAIHEAILNCGCSLFFPVQTIPGELLLCRFHDDWFKSRPAAEKKPVGMTHYVRCNSCANEYGPIQRSYAYTMAKRHSVGKNGNKSPRHEVMVGKPSGDEIIWQQYEYKGASK